jgi:flagellar protein FliJ
VARRFPLETVRQLAQRRTADAATELQGHSTRLRAAQDKLKQLQGYRDEYRSAKANAMVQGVAMARLREFETFLARIEEAIAAQTLEVQRAEVLWEAARAHWAEQHRREKAMDTLADRHTAQELQREIRQDRKAQDEFSARVKPGPMKIRLK